MSGEGARKIFDRVFPGSNRLGDGDEYAAPEATGDTRARDAGASGIARKRVLFIRNPVFRLCCCRDFRGAGRAIRSSLLFRPRPLCVRRRRLYTCIYPPYTYLFYRCGMAPKGMEQKKKKILNLGQREKNETLLTREAGSRKTGG